MVQTDTIYSDTIAYDSIDSVAPAPSQPNDSVLFVFDSVFKAPYASQLPPSKSLFSGTILHPQHSDPQPLTTNYHNGLVFGVVVFLVLVLSLFLRGRRIRLNPLIKAAFSQRRMDNLVRDCNIKTDVEFVPVALLYYASLAVVGFFALVKVFHSSITPYQFLDFSIILVGTWVYYLVKNGLIRTFGAIFGDSDTVRTYILNCYFFQAIASMLVLPLTLFAFYTSATIPFLIAIISITALFFIIRLLRSLALILTNSGDRKSVV